VAKLLQLSSALIKNEINVSRRAAGGSNQNLELRGASVEWRIKQEKKEKI
jgi:hypothetical protein